MITVIVLQALYIAATLLLAGKDADSYLLKDNSVSRLNLDRVNRWHRDGFLLAAIIAVLVVYAAPEHWIFLPVACVLIRASFFDIAFNKWAGLPLSYLGSTAWIDQQFLKVFSKNGAWFKCGLAFISLVALNYIFRQ